MPTRRKDPGPVDHRLTVQEMQDALPKLARRREELEALDPNAINSEDDEAPFDEWHPMWNETLGDIYPRNSIQYMKYEIHTLREFGVISMTPDWLGGGGGRYNVGEAREAYGRGKAKALQIIRTLERSFSERLKDAGERPAPITAPLASTAEPAKANDVEIVERLLRRFHQAARPLTQRHDGRDAFVISDEYDVQDLLHALLRSLFDDVRPEEYTPGYAGAASRMDFLLKAERIVVEAKMASEKLRDRLVGEQLMIDIQRYRAHADCKHLLCFVYDPGGFIKNPHGLEADLTRTHDGLDVRVIVSSH